MPRSILYQLLIGHPHLAVTAKCPTRLVIPLFRKFPPSAPAQIQSEAALSGVDMTALSVGTGIIKL